jgi:hypothetical protein
MTTRIFIAGILGGIVMFFWNFVAHDILPLGHTGMRQVPNESAVIDTLRTNMGDNHGLFVFPWVDPNASREVRKEVMEKIGTNPSGLLVYHPQRPFSFPRMVGIEFVTEILEAILVVFLLSSTRLLTAGSRILFVTIAGVVAAMVTNVPYWNFWGFPKRYTLALMFIQIVGFFLVGVVSAFVLRNRDPVAESK